MSQLPMKRRLEEDEINQETSRSVKMRLLDKAKRVNPWLLVREPLRATKYPADRDRPEYFSWFGCISVENNDVLNLLSGTTRGFKVRQGLGALSIEFGQQIQADDGCKCKRECLHTHFILDTIGDVKRMTAYLMACAAFQQLGLVPSVDVLKAFSYLASVYKREFLSDMLR